MKHYQDIKHQLLALVKSNSHYEKVYVTPKDSHIKPYWKTVKKKNDDKGDVVPKMKAPEEKTTKREKKQVGETQTIVKPSASLTNSSNTSKPTKMSPPKQGGSTKFVRDYDSWLPTYIGNQHYDNLKSIAEKSNSTSAKLWDKYADGIRVVHEDVTTDEAGRQMAPCYFQPIPFPAGDGCIHCNMDTISKSTSYRIPYASFYHESGHLIDHKHSKVERDEDTGKPYYASYSHTYKNGAFAKAIHKDVQALFKKYDSTGSFYNVLKADSDISAQMWDQVYAGTLDADWLESHGIVSFTNDTRGKTRKKNLNERLASRHNSYDKRKGRINKKDGFEPDVLDEWEADIYDWASDYTNSKFTEDEIDTAYDALDEFLDEFKSYDLRSTNDLSDIIEGATKGAVTISCGHGSDYWDRQDRMLSTEAFAEMMAASISNPASLKFIQKCLPSAYKVYQEMVQTLLDTKEDDDDE